MRDIKLENILDAYEPEQLRLVVLDGFKIYRKHDNEKLWEWDAEFDGAPYDTLMSLFKRCGLEPER